MPALNVFELPRQPGLSELLGQGLGQGIGQGLSSGVEQYQKMATQQRQMSLLANILGLGEGGEQQMPPQGQDIQSTGKIGIPQLLALHQV